MLLHEWVGWMHASHEYSNSKNTIIPSFRVYLFRSVNRSVSMRKNERLSSRQIVWLGGCMLDWFLSLSVFERKRAECTWFWVLLFFTYTLLYILVLYYLQQLVLHSNRVNLTGSCFVSMVCFCAHYKKKQNECKLLFPLNPNPFETRWDVDPTHHIGGTVNFVYTDSVSMQHFE